MSKYGYGNVVIGQNFYSLVMYPDSEVKTEFLKYIKPGDALLLYRRDANWNQHWSVYCVTKVESDSLLYFTPKFSTGNPGDTPANYNHLFEGQVDNADSLSPDGRYCDNSNWYASRDFTCFFDLPEIKKGDRAWAEIYNSALTRIDMLLKKSNRYDLYNYNFNGGYINTEKGVVQIKPEDPVDPPADGYYNAGLACSAEFGTSAIAFIDNLSNEVVVDVMNSTVIKKFDTLAYLMKFFGKMPGDKIFNFANIPLNPFTEDYMSASFIDVITLFTYRAENYLDPGFVYADGFYQDIQVRKSDNSIQTVKASTISYDVSKAMSLMSTTPNIVSMELLYISSSNERKDIVIDTTLDPNAEQLMETYVVYGLQNINSVFSFYFIPVNIDSVRCTDPEYPTLFYQSGEPKTTTIFDFIDANDIITNDSYFSATFEEFVSNKKFTDIYTAMFYAINKYSSSPVLFDGIYINNADLPGMPKWASVFVDNSDKNYFYEILADTLDYSTYLSPNIIPIFDFVLTTRFVNETYILPYTIRLRDAIATAIGIVGYCSMEPTFPLMDYASNPELGILYNSINGYEDKYTGILKITIGEHPTSKMYIAKVYYDNLQT